MPQLVRDLFSWLHISAVSYDYESIEPSTIGEFDLNTAQRRKLPAVKSLPGLKWATPTLIQRIRQPSSPILLTIKEHSSPILQRAKQDPSWKKFIKSPVKKITPAPSVSNLESLPNELKLAIMQRLPSVNAMHQLSLTSTSFRQFCSQHNPAIVPFVLQNELGLPLFEEAYWASQAAQADLFAADYPQRVKNFLNEWICSEPDSIQVKNVPFKTIVDMTTLHSKITFLLKDFCSWTMEESTKLSPSPSCVSLSDNETLRISRAFYRLELFCLLFRHREVRSADEALGREYEICKNQAYKLLDNWNAWENEEIACVCDYIYARLATVFTRIQQAAYIKPFSVILYDPWDEVPEIFPSGTVYLSSDLIPGWYDERSNCGANLSPQGIHYDEFREMFLSQGVECLSNLFSADDVQQQSDIFMSKWAAFSHNPDCFGFFTGELKATPLRMRHASETREAFFHGDEEFFEGDEGAEGPSFGWLWAGEGKFQPYYASADRVHLRRWGYVMWDHKRLIESSACSSSPNLRDPFWRCEKTLIEAHEQTCLRKSAGNKDGGSEIPLPITAEEDQLSDTEDDSEDVEPEDQSVVHEDPELRTQVNIDDMKESAAELTKTSSDSGYSSEPNLSLPSEALNSSHAAQNQPFERDTGPQDAPATTNALVDETIHASIQEEELSGPVLSECAPQSDLDTMCSGFSSEELGRSKEDVPQGFETVSNDVKDLNRDPFEDCRAVEAAAHPEEAVKVFTPRKFARPVSPKAKLLRSKQRDVREDEDSSADSAETIPSPGSTVIQLHAPSPPSPDSSSTSCGSRRSVNSTPSETSEELSPSSAQAAERILRSAPRWAQRGRKIQCRGAKKPTPTKNTGEEPEEKAEPGAELAEDRTCQQLHAKDPKDVAAWIEQSDSRPSQSPHTPSPSSSKSGDASTDASSTKQQRKKANRRARRVATETAIKQAEEMEAERVKAEEARKEHQRMKKERKKLEKEIGGTTKGKKNQAGVKSGQGQGKESPGKKGRKMGYLIG